MGSMMKSASATAFARSASKGTEKNRYFLENDRETVKNCCLFFLCRKHPIKFKGI